MSTVTAAVWDDTRLHAHARSTSRAVAVAGFLYAVAAVEHAMLAASYGPTDGAEVVAVFAGFALVVAGVLWLQWFHALVRPLTMRGAVRYPGWSRWAWIVPVVSLVMPRMLVNDVWRSGGRGRQPWQVHVWWALWVAAWLTRMVPGDADSPLAVALFGGLVAVCAPFAVVTISLLTRRAGESLGDRNVRT